MHTWRVTVCMAVAETTADKFPECCWTSHYRVAQKNYAALSKENTKLQESSRELSHAYPTIVSMKL